MVRGIIFKLDIRLRIGIFLMDNHKNFERFQYLNFETSVLKIKNPFQKAGVMFLVKSAKIENLIL